MLGSDRFGPIYLAHDGEIDQDVVIRVFDGFAGREAEVLAALEALSERALGHRSIAQPLASGTTGERPYLVHRYLEGLTLHEFLARHGRQPFPEVVRRTTELADALDTAAEAGVHHGLFGPREVVFGADVTGITGLGLAQALGAAGVPVPGASPSRAADVRALALVAFQLATGQPYRGSFHPLGVVTGCDDDALRSAFEAAIADDGSRFPATALDFARSLAQALLPAASGAPTSAPGEDALRDMPLRREIDTVIDESPLPPWAAADPGEAAPSGPAPPPVDQDGRSHSAAVDGADGLLMAAAGDSEPREGSAMSARSAWPLTRVAAAAVVGAAVGFAAGFVTGRQGLQAPAPVDVADAASFSGGDEPGAAVPVPPAPGGAPAVAVEDRAAPTPVPPRPVEAPPPQPLSPPPPARGAAANSRTAPSSAPPPAGVRARPADAEPGPGALEVLSRPAGALVYVDGVLVGRTPLTLPEVGAGERAVRLDLPGHRPWATTVTVRAGERRRVAASLEP